MDPRRVSARGRMGPYSRLPPHEAFTEDRDTQVSAWVTGHEYFFHVEPSGQAKRAMESGVDGTSLSGSPGTQAGQPAASKDGDKGHQTPESTHSVIMRGHTAPPRNGWPQHMRVSVHERVAAALNLSTGSNIWISPVPTREWPEHELEHVELTVIDSFVSRSDLWGLMQALRHSTVFPGKRFTFPAIGSGITVKAMLPPRYNIDNRRCSSGIVTSNTRLTVRSLSSRMIWLFQLSREMFLYTDDGDMYLNRATDIFLRDVTRKWKDTGCKHSCLMVLFARVKRSDGEQDYFRVVCEVTGNDTETLDHMSQAMKKAVHKMMDDMDAGTPTNSYFSRDSTRTGVLSTAKMGNVLEAINLALNAFARHHIDRSLNCTGQTVVILTAGSGLFRTTSSLARLTSQRMLDAGVGCEMICLRRPPLHIAPFFEYSSEDVSSFASTSGSPTPHNFYERPRWMTIRFYCKRRKTSGPEFLNTLDCDLYTFKAASELFQRLHASFMPQCCMVSARIARENVLREEGPNPVLRLHALLADREIEEPSGQLLRPDWERLDAQAFHFEREPMTWTAQPIREDDGPSSPHLCTQLSMPDAHMRSLSVARHQRTVSEDFGRSMGKTLAETATWGSSFMDSRRSINTPERQRGESIAVPTAAHRNYTRTSEHDPVGYRPLFSNPFDVNSTISLDSTDSRFIEMQRQELQRLKERNPFEEANVNRWAHMFPADESPATGGISHMWKFIIEPVLLPLTSPYYPVIDAIDEVIPGFELHPSQKTTHSNGVVPLPPGRNGLQVYLNECIVQRLHQGYQFVPPIVDNTYRLSIGHQFHELSVITQQYQFHQWIHQEYKMRQQQPFSSLRDHRSFQSLCCSYLSNARLGNQRRSTPPTVRAPIHNQPALSSSLPTDQRGPLDARYDSSVSRSAMLPRGMVPEFCEYSYFLNNPYTAGWDSRHAHFINESGNVFVNWSGLDQLLSGAQDETELATKDTLIDPLFRPRKVKYVLLPTMCDTPATREGFYEGIPRLLDQICTGGDFQLLRKELLQQVTKADGPITVDLDDIAVSSTADDTQPFELVLEHCDARKGGFLSAIDWDDGQYQPDPAGVPLSSGKPPNAAPRPEVIARSLWIALGVSRNFHPRCFFSFIVTWLSCPGTRVSGFMDLVRRRMLQTMGHSYRLVQVPYKLFSRSNISISGESRYAPFRSYVWIPVRTTSILRRLVLHLLNDMSYVPANQSVTWASVLLHISGEAIIRLPDTERGYQEGEAPENGIFFLLNPLHRQEAREGEQVDHYRRVVTAVEAVEVACDVIRTCISESFHYLTIDTRVPNDENNRGGAQPSPSTMSCSSTSSNLST
eukprot:Sspe_Gene.16772::Locus_5925_Transcript_1_1_Confidence_1.000_Length_4565::g.16772::m.16772/K20404/DEPDC5; DEP domain-containing protein 5